MLLFTIVTMCVLFVNISLTSPANKDEAAKWWTNGTDDNTGASEGENGNTTDVEGALGWTNDTYDSRGAYEEEVANNIDADGAQGQLLSDVSNDDTKDILPNVLHMIVFDLRMSMEVKAHCSIRSATGIAIRKIRNNVLPGKKIIYIPIDSTCSKYWDVTEMSNFVRPVPPQRKITIDVVIGEHCR